MYLYRNVMCTERNDNYDVKKVLHKVVHDADRET